MRWTGEISGPGLATRGRPLEACWEQERSKAPLRTWAKAVLGTCSVFKAPYPLLQDEVLSAVAISGPRRSWAPTWYAL